MYFLSWIMSKKLTVKLINNKKIRIYKGSMEETTEKSFEQILKEEREKVIAEVKEKIRKKKAMMNPDPNYSFEHRFKNITYEKRNSNKS